jgi:chromosome segregation ATPase
MKVKSTCTLSFLVFLIFLFPIHAFAVVWDISDDDLKKVAFELKKFNTHLENLKNTQIKSLQGQQEDLLRQIEEIKQILPQLLGTIDQNKQEILISIGRTNSKMADLEAEVKNQVLDEIHQQNKILQLFRQEQANLKEGLAQDMEKFEKFSKSNFQDFSTANQKTLGRVVQQLEAQSATTKKGFDDTIALFRTEVIPTIANENQKNRQMVLNHLTSANKETRKSLEAFSAKNQKLNQKLIEILQESLKLGVGTKSLLDSIKKDLEINHASLEGTNNKLKIADEKFNKLAESLKSLQAQNTTTSETLGALKADLEHSGEFNKLADEKFNKLIELTSELAVHSTELEESVVGQLKESALKEDASNIKVDLANEKLSRLIEILKTIAKEQTKLDPLATTLGAMQKEQVALQKTQAVLMKNQKETKEALADLRRKANVNISRNDEIKKTLRQLSSAKSGAGRK